MPDDNTSPTAAIPPGTQVSEAETEKAAMAWIQKRQQENLQAASKIMEAAMAELDKFGFALTITPTISMIPPQQIAIAPKPR